MGLTLVTSLVVACTFLAVSAGAAIAKPGCESSCGNLTIPYPFGTREGCYRNPEFLITCNSSSGHPMANISNFNIRILSFSLDTGELRATTWISYMCYHPNGDSSGVYTYFNSNISYFAISNTKNTFTVVGCDTAAYIQDLSGKKFATGCTSICLDRSYVVNGSCAGVGCCQTSFPKDLTNYEITISSYNNHTGVWRFNPCSYAFPAEEGSFNFSTQDLLNLSNRTDSPMILNWVVDNQTCAEAIKNTGRYACEDNSVCIDSDSGLIGYLCQCKPGFQGNPYLPDGCQDVDECSTSNNCSPHATCHNFGAGYNCSCPLGYTGDGYTNGTRCTLNAQSKDNVLILKTTIGIGVALVVLIALISSLCWVHKQRTLTQLKRRHFEQNGGTMLLLQFSQQQGYTSRTKIFIEDELKNATNDFDESRILGRGGQGTVYKGILPDNTHIAIKKSRVGEDPRQVNDFINEVAVLSHINHRNVVKLLGCCLETEVPLLVYEFVDNGTLLDHIDPSKNECPIPWEIRLQIAAETAEAISYLHSAASPPIIHRDIKSANILLDHDHKAKVSDFGASRLVPLDETQIATVVQGTFGYLDPEYLHTGQLNEKSDVYSFGVVLVELLTGKKAFEFNRPEQKKLAMYFVSSMKEDRLWEILDRRVLDQRKNAEQLKEVALLARRCVGVKGEERPTMKEVAMELEGLIAMEKHPWGKGKDLISEESEYLLGNVHDGYGPMGTSNSTGYDSIQKQVAFEIEDGR